MRLEASLISYVTLCSAAPSDRPLALPMTKAITARATKSYVAAACRDLLRSKTGIGRYHQGL